MGVIRSAYLINVQGNIIKIWINVRVLNHASEVLETLKNNIKT